jgi:hypothetical protein
MKDLFAGIDLHGSAGARARPKSDSGSSSEDDDGIDWKSWNAQLAVGYSIFEDLGIRPTFGTWRGVSHRELAGREKARAVVVREAFHGAFGSNSGDTLLTAYAALARELAAVEDDALRAKVDQLIADARVKVSQAGGSEF